MVEGCRSTCVCSTSSLSLCIGVCTCRGYGVQECDLGLVRSGWSCLGDAPVWNRANCFEDGWCWMLYLVSLFKFNIDLNPSFHCFKLSSTM